ncbi:carboxypeptidase regulatory-like domain-containing protein [Bacillus norwichensis]|uniref:Carboxypeptidase regulatory-like domain-containing protein n=1 Tax=Bacillus norwichensis TaxID=2762217 RepID=A0ABR8VNH5_9BACI|nr:carboxypeptidase regulatory-like domain-containing protein [Bacillus norwichensis]MBD8006315.1 carboxypeptidase regulatory-like domain-containing protein [Bacillus norwichensis]
MKIKIKVKHLVFILISISFIAFVINPQLQLYIAKKQAEYWQPAAKVKLLKSLNSKMILDSQKQKIIQDYMLKNHITNQFDVYIGPSFSHYNPPDHAVTFTWDEMLPHLNRYVKKSPIDDDYASATKLLAFHYKSIGQLDQAYDILQSAIERTSVEDSWVRERLQLDQIQMMMEQADYSAAEQLLQKVSEKSNPDDYYLQAEIDQKKIEMEIYQGHLQKAYKEVKNTLTEYKAKQIDEDVYEQLLSMKNSLQNALDKRGNVIHTVKGRIVYSDGSPVSNAGVFLRSEEKVSRSVGPGEAYQVTTDTDGYFNIPKVLSGSYQVALGLSFDQINGWTWPVNMDEWLDVGEKKTITYNITLQKLIKLNSPVNQQKITDKHILFSWEKVEGADYYQLSLGADIDSGSVSTVFKSYITDNQINIPIEEVYNHPLGVIFSGDNLSTISPKSLLAFTNTNSQFYWSVDAYRANGERLTSSSGYRLDEDTIGNLPFFYLKERNLTKADRLLLSKKLKKALAAYQSNYEKDPDDIHSLRMIIRLIGAESDANATENEESIPYLQAYAEKTNSTQALFSLIDYYYEKQQWDSFHKWFNTYEAAVGNRLDEYDQAIYASALMKQGKVKEASERFKQVMELDKSHRFVGSWLAVELYDGKTFEHALTIARDYPERPFSDEKRDWFQMVQALQEESKTDPHYRKELKEGLDLYFKNEHEGLSHWMQTTDKPAMKKFIAAVKDVR